jgi:hypothetical protein
MCWLRVFKSHSVWSMIHPSAIFEWEKLQALHPAAVAIRSTLLAAHNPAAVGELERPLRGSDTTADHTTPSLQFAGERGDDGPTAWRWRQGIVLRQEEHLPRRHFCDFVVDQRYWDAYDLFLGDDRPEKWMSFRLDGIVADTFSAQRLKGPIHVRVSLASPARLGFQWAKLASETRTCTVMLCCSVQ